MGPKIISENLHNINILSFTMDHEKYVPASNMSEFGTDCKDLLTMTKEFHVWLSFPTELEDRNSANIFFGL